MWIDIKQRPFYNDLNTPLPLQTLKITTRNEAAWVKRAKGAAEKIEFRFISFREDLPQFPAEYNPDYHDLFDPLSANSWMCFNGEENGFLNTPASPDVAPPPHDFKIVYDRYTDEFHAFKPNQRVPIKFEINLLEHIPKADTKNMNFLDFIFHEEGFEMCTPSI